MSASESVLLEQRSKGPPAPDFFKNYPASRIVEKAQTPVAALARFKADGKPLFWFNADRSAVVVDERLSSTLSAVSVPGMLVSQTVVLGRLTPQARALQGRGALELFLRADVVRTYVHLRSTLCLVTDRAVPGGSYLAEVDGQHTYFTSKEHVEAFAFRFELAANGDASVTRTR